MKKILLLSLVALFALCSCEKDYTKDLAGTSWKASEKYEGTIMGAPVVNTLNVSLNFLAEAEGNMSLSFTSKVDGQEVANESRKNDFTFTYDSRNGVITTIPNEGEEENRYMFHTYGDTLLTIDMKYNALDYELKFRK